MVEEDDELQNLWKEVRNEDHGDLKSETGIPTTTSSSKFQKLCFRMTTLFLNKKIETSRGEDNFTFNVVLPHCKTREI